MVYGSTGHDEAPKARDLAVSVQSLGEGKLGDTKSLEGIVDEWMDG